MSKSENLLLKEIELVSIVRVFCAALESGFQHDIGFKDPSESVSHLYSDKSRYRLTFQK